MDDTPSLVERFNKTRKKERSKQEQEEMVRKERDRETRTRDIQRSNLVDNGESPPSTGTFRECLVPGCSKHDRRDSVMSTAPSNGPQVGAIAAGKRPVPTVQDSTTSVAEVASKARDNDDSPENDGLHRLPSYASMNSGDAPAEEELEEDADQNVRTQDLKAIIRQKNEKIAGLQHDIKGKDDEIEAINAQLAELEDRIDHAASGEEENKWEKRYERAKKRIDDLREENKKLRVELRATEDKRDDFRRELRRVRNQAQEEKHKLERQLQEANSRANAHKSLAEDLMRTLQSPQQLPLTNQIEELSGLDAPAVGSQRDVAGAALSSANLQDWDRQTFNPGRDHRRRSQTEHYIRSEFREGERPRHSIQIRRASGVQRLTLGALGRK